ncbi:MAG: glycoside hydrolase family 2 [Clostridia bacterium]|nr:glycoside hydrolase family 2 [Clostridia bacterium]
MLKTKYFVGDYPLSEHPHPQKARENVFVLNGTWRFAVAKNEENVTVFDRVIKVPFSPESENSGIGGDFALKKDEKLVYERDFELYEDMLMGITELWFGAVDQTCEVFFNGECVGGHNGGFTPFVLDVTKQAKLGKNTLRVECVDVTTDSHGARGKQNEKRGGIWYTPQSGIWQPVWLESRREDSIGDFTVKTDAQSKAVTILTDYDKTVGVKVYNGEQEIISTEFIGSVTLIYDFELWSPENPKLYDFVLTTQSGDKISSYFGVRSFGEGVDVNGKKRLLLNGKPYFFNGVLDQGYWSDGLLTYPSDEAVVDELNMLKNMGFNTVRKHIKLEPFRWYYYCDKIGLTVWQDFVSGGGEYDFMHIAALPFLGFKHKDNDYKYFAREEKKGRDEFMQMANETLHYLKNFTCISLWTIFNEGWGQFDSYQITQYVLQKDDTRLIDSVSGWHDQGKKKTTLKSLHTYYTPLRVPRDCRPVVLSEFGGYSMKISGHVFDEDKEFGYKKFKSKDELQSALKKLYLNKVKPLIKKGLCACIYTQVSDVEEEINGLTTYDRAVQKVDTDFMRAINAELATESSQVELK